jgi:class 3 adenylate cyclase
MLACMICPSCGAELPGGARFCPACGRPVEDRPTDRERKLVTILFADLVGSTALAERLDPEHVRDVLDTYFAAMRDEIDAEGGTVEKFVGDAVMAAFGVPTAHEDDPARALRAAARMRRRLVAVNEDLGARHGVSLEVRLGVNTGEVIATVDPRPGEPFVTGDAVNAAARLQTSADPGEVLVADRTARAVRGFRFGEARAIRVKGKAEPVLARPLEGESDDDERGVPGLTSPLVGRDRELDLLRTVYDRVAGEARPHLVTLYGEPGVGKSRLTREFVAALGERAPSPLVLQGRCLPYGDGVTYWPLAEILKAHAGIDDADPPDAILAKVRRRCDLALGGGDLTPERACAALAYTIGVEEPGARIGEREPRQVRREMHTAWRGFFTSLALTRPVVTVIEDIHWADPALLDLLEEVADRVDGSLLLLCPARPALLDRRPGWSGGRRNASAIDLEPLTDEDADRLVAHLLTVEDLPPRTHDLILARAEGNPFFLEEIVRQLIDEGRIVYEDGRWRAAVGIDDVQIPDTVQGVLAARIDLLEPSAKRALQLAAVVGRVFWPAPVGRLLNGDGEDLAGILGRLQERDLVRARPRSALAGHPEYAFKHVLTRDVAYESLPKRDRSRAHATVADWIETTSGARSEFGELLAYHLEAALRAERDDARGDPERAEALRGRAFDATLSAAEDARRRFAIHKALTLADRAVALAVTPLERARALERLGRICIDDYRGDRAWTAYREAVELRREHVPDDVVALADACARAVESPTRWPGSMMSAPSPAEVDELIDVGLASAPPGDNEPRIRLLIARAFGPFSAAGQDVPVSRELLDAGRRAGLEAIDAASRIGRPDLTSAALDAVIAGAVAMGSYGPELPHVERRLALDVEDPWERGDAEAMAAWAYGMIGRFRDAARHAYAGVELADEVAEGISLHSMAWGCLAEFSLGNWDAVADTLTSRIEALMADRELPYFMSNFAGTAAFIAHARGAPRAPERIERLRALAETWSGRSTSAAVWLAWVQLRSGRPAEGRRTLDTVAAISFMGSRPMTEQVRALEIAAAARWDEVPGYLEATRRYAADAGLEALPVHLRRLEGRAAAAAGDLDAAADILTETSASFADLGATWERACTDVWLAEVHADAGRRDEARTPLDAAIAEFERLRSEVDLVPARALAARLA